MACCLKPGKGVGNAPQLSVEVRGMKIRVCFFLAALGLMLAAAILGNVLESKGIVTRETLGPDGITAVIVLFLGLFCLVCLTLIPLVIRLFIRGQIKIGNGELTVIKWLREHENAVVVAFWGLFILGVILIYVLAREEIFRELM